MKTTDNKSYYSRTGDYKSNIVFDYIKNKDDINFIYDVGCNNGNISYQLQTKLNKRVLGIDLSDDLQHPIDFDFKKEDIVTSNNIVYNDCTLFFSLYHHIFGKYGIDTADDIFLKLLLRSNYLLFDTGNLSEVSRLQQYCYISQQKYFKNQIDLLNHFDLPYSILGNWKCGGGVRNVVLFDKVSFEDTVEILNIYKRKKGSSHQKFGLFEITSNETDCTDFVIFRKIKWKNKILFAKKRKDIFIQDELKEMSNIVKAYKVLDESKLIKFYGYSEKFGLIFEWLDGFEYLKKIKIPELGLQDVDMIKLANGTIKYIDFER